MCATSSVSIDYLVVTCLNTFSYVDQCCLHLFVVFFVVVDMSAIAQIACKEGENSNVVDCVLSFLVLSRSRHILPHRVSCTAVSYLVRYHAVWFRGLGDSALGEVEVEVFTM